MGLSPAFFHQRAEQMCRRKEFALKKILKKIWCEFELYLMVVLMIGFIFTVFWGIVSRVLLRAPASWTEEMARIMFIWMVFLGLSYSTLRGTHIQVTFLTDALFKGKARQVLELVIYLITLGIFGWLLVTGIQYVEYCSAVKTPAMQLPRSWFVSILPLTGALMVIRTAYQIVRCVKRLFAKNDDRKEAAA